MRLRGSAPSAKLTARLAAGQDPDACLYAIVRHLEAHVPPGLRLAIDDKGVAGPGLRLSPDSAAVSLARKTLAQLTDKQVVYLWEGASIPIIPALARAAGAEPLMVGFAGEQDRAHAPNESFSVEQFRLGYLYAGLSSGEVWHTADYGDSWAKLPISLGSFHGTMSLV